ncbi:macro domain-like protein [Suhomyces tanzawaensis NRRL Y-17324]|uniref:Macro domain-like protein n=1 Tax=Suhomyces tanzawaensis NRRL Y-17324 TaxID=984487 RepID=A0A1E4SMW0_9ASCO|nr:macro domain-like protein [Suhomyces tanzawaensis NRRL Y-17324]ODV80853.1 macro domain-like protein [Suhomyces tanzawaensis NRRL Y-17324]
MLDSRVSCIFIDNNPDVVEQWKIVYDLATKFFQSCTSASIHLNGTFVETTIESLLSSQALCKGETAILTPTNSAAYMGAGFDRYLLEALLMTVNSPRIDYKTLERLIQEYTLEKYNGYLPISTVNEIKLPQLAYPYHESLARMNWNLTTVLAIPSMVVPEMLSEKEAKLVIVNSIWNLFLYLENSSPKNLIIPGIATGYGKLDPRIAAKLMLSTAIIYSSDFTGRDKRYSFLKKTVLLMFLLNKNYKNFENVYDINELESHVLSDLGIISARSLCETSSHIYDIDELFTFVR